MKRSETEKRKKKIMLQLKEERANRKQKLKVEGSQPQSFHSHGKVSEKSRRYGDDEEDRIKDINKYAVKWREDEFSTVLPGR